MCVPSCVKTMDNGGEVDFHYVTMSRTDPGQAHHPCGRSPEVIRRPLFNSMNRESTLPVDSVLCDYL